MIFTLRIEEAVAQLRRAYPVRFPRIDDFELQEPSDWPDNAGETYEGIHREFIGPIERAYHLSLRIGTAIANHFGAHG